MISIAVKTASEHCEHEVQRNDFESYLEEFRLELLRDRGMLLMLEKGMHCGTTQASQCYNTVNNKQMIKQCNLVKTS